MPRSRRHEDDDDVTDPAVDDADRDLPLESDMSDDADDDAAAVDPCPHCGKMIHEDAEWCHHCGKYLSREDAPKRVPLWVLIGTALVLGITVFWMLGR